MSNTDTDLMIMTMRSTNYIERIYELIQKNKLIDNLITFSKEEQVNFLVFVINFKKLPFEERKEREQLIIESYDNMVENLFYKCINNQLTESESKLLLLILSYLLYN